MENLYNQYPNAKDFAMFLIEEAEKLIKSKEINDLVEKALEICYDKIIDFGISDELANTMVSFQIYQNGPAPRKVFYWDPSDKNAYRMKFLILPIVSIADRKNMVVNLGCSISVSIRNEKDIIDELHDHGYRQVDKRRYINDNIITRTFSLKNKFINNSANDLMKNEISKFLTTKGLKENQDFNIKTSKNKILIEFNSNEEYYEETSTWDSKPKYLVGDSVKFKDGRTGIVEDYDEKHLYVRDNNANIVKIFKDNAPKDYTSIQNMASRLKTIIKETSTFQEDKNFGAVEFKKLLEANGFEVEYVENKSGTWQKDDYNEYFKNYDIKLTDGQHIYFRVIADDNFDTKEIICYLNGKNW